tara:strand:+ start:129 stop:377 length:249 start_codon:yes stop_codon:yes gene_type:complete
MVFQDPAPLPEKQYIPSSSVPGIGYPSGQDMRAIQRDADWREQYWEDFNRRVWQSALKEFPPGLGTRYNPYQNFLKKALLGE